MAAAGIPAVNIGATNTGATTAKAAPIVTPSQSFLDEGFIRTPSTHAPAKPNIDAILVVPPAIKKAGPSLRLRQTDRQDWAPHKR